MVIRKKRRIKWKNVFLALFVLICLVGLGTSLFNIIKWKIEAKTTNNQIETAQKVVKPVEIIDNDKIEIIEQEKVPLDNPYWEYVQMNLIDVDFNDLKNINPSTIGWIQVNGTNINYPFVQTNDNKFYLNHEVDFYPKRECYKFLSPIVIESLLIHPNNHILLNPGFFYHW